MTKPLPERVAAVLETHAVRGRRVAVGLSGGVDSVVLLDVLGRLRQDLRLALSAVHVNHQISAHSLAWEAFCKARCQAYGVMLTVRRVQVPRDGSGVEAAARNLRYQAYGRLDTDLSPWRTISMTRWRRFCCNCCEARTQGPGGEPVL